MATTTPPPAKALAFTDARGCKEWLNALPLTNIPQAQLLVLEQARAVNATEADGLERLKCLELMRDKIAFLQGEQRSRYYGKSLPLSPNDSTAWGTGRSLLEEMEQGYRLCLAAGEEDGGEIGRLRAHVMQRIVRYIGAQMLFHALAYRRFDPQLWTRLHKQYLLAEGEGLAGERVKDSLEGEGGASSAAEAYAQAVLIQAAFLSEMTGPQMDFAEALLRLWVHSKVRVLQSPAEGNNATHDALVVDLDKSIGARPQARSELKGNHRIIDTEQLSRSIRRRIHGLQTGEDLATLGMPPEASAVDSMNELKRLHKLWCEGAPPRPAAQPSKTEKAGLVWGMNDIHFFVSGGKVFEQPDKKRELTPQEKQDIEVFGRVRDQTASKMMGALNFQVESWAVVDEMLGAVRVQRPTTSSKGIAIGKLAALRMGDTGPFLLGMVSELVHETDNRIIATITLFPGKPEPMPVRAGDVRNRANAQWQAGFRLPALEKMRIPASFVVPSGMGLRGRGVEAWVDGAGKESTVEEVLERGADFERVTVF
jgi:cyclic-di-GMP-binding protein